MDNTKSDEERQIIVFKLNDEQFGIDIAEVREIIKNVETTKIPNTDSYVDGVINLRGNIVAIVDLKKKLGLSSNDSSKENRVIVVEIYGSNIGIKVDMCNEVLNLPKKKINDPPKVTSSGINGDYLEGIGVLDNRLIILIKLSKILGLEDIQKVKSQTPSNI